MTITYRYAREEMMTLRESVPSRTRPDNLSSEFNNDDGLFSPDRWIQHRWQCEGLSNSSTLRKPAVNSRADNVANSAHDLEQTVLSPQRRGFTSGCRVPSPKFGVDEKAGKSSRWRHGHINGVDFKSSFQKNALESSTRRTANNNNSSVWRNSNSSSDRHWTDKGRNNRGTYDNEKMPEWLEEGPSSMTDIIELKGFEDDVSEKKTKKRKGKQSGSETSGRCRNSSAQGSRPSSRTHIESGCVVEELPPLRQDADGNFFVVEQKTGTSGNNNSSVKNIEDVVSEMVATTVLSKDKRNSLSEGISTTISSNETFHVLADALPTHESSTIAVGAKPATVKNNFPDSDAEFAAYLGIVDIDPSTVKKKDYRNEQSSTQLVSSRLSRFFANNTSNAAMSSNLPSQSLQESNNDGDGTPALDVDMASMLSISKQQHQQHLLSNHSSAFDNQQQNQLFQHHQHHLMSHRPIMGHSSSAGMGLPQAAPAAQSLFEQTSTNSGAGVTSNNNVGLPSVLKQLFATAGATSTAKRLTPSTIANVATSSSASSTVEFNGAITVEELERRLASNMTLNGNNNKGPDQGGSTNVFSHHHHSSMVPQNAGGAGNGGDLIEALIANKQQPVHHHHASFAQQQLPMPPPPPPFPPIAPATLAAAASIAAEMGPLPSFNSDFVRSQFYVNAVAAGFNPVALFQAARLHQQQQQNMMMQQQQQQQNHLIRRLSPSNDLSSLPNAVIGKMLAHRAAQAAAVAAVASASSMNNSSGGESSHFQQRIQQQQREQGAPSNYNAAIFASDQQQLNLAITRGDLATAQTIRARMIAQVQALAGVPPFQG